MSHANAATVHLAHGESLALPDIQGTALMVTRGTVWITQENDTKDVILNAGDLWMVDHEGLTIIEAQNDASMQAGGPNFERATAGREPLAPWVPEQGQAVFPSPAGRPAPHD